MSVYVSQYSSRPQRADKSETALLFCLQLMLWSYYCASRCTIIWIWWVSMSASSSRPQRVDECKRTLLLCPQLCYKTTILPPTVVLSGYYECLCQPAAPDHTGWMSTRRHWYCVPNSACYEATIVPPTAILIGESDWMQGDTAIVSPTLLWSYYCASHGCIKWVIWMFLSASSSRPQRVDKEKD